MLRTRKNTIRDRLAGALKQGPLQGVLALVSGTAAAQALTILAAPILTRLYSPESFGAYSYVVSVSAVVISIATFRLELAIPLADDLGDAQRLTRMAMGSAVAWALFTGLVVAVFHAQLSAAADFEIMPWAIWLPFLILFSSWFVVLSQAALRARAYTAVATRSLIQSVGTVGGQLLFATVTRSAGGLLSGLVIGRMFGISSLARTNRELLRKPHRGTYRETLRSYRTFPLVFAPSAVLNTLGMQLPLVLLGAWFGIESAGLLAVAQRIAMIPAAVIGIAVGQVFYGELSARLRSGERDNRRLFLTTSTRLGAIGVAVAVGLATLPPLLFPIILGSNWAGSAAFAQAMAPSIGLGFMVGPLSYVFDAYQRGGAQLALDVSRVVMVGGLGYVAHRNGWSALNATWAMYAGQLANHVLTWIYAFAIVSGHGTTSAPPQPDLSAVKLTPP